MQVSELTDLSRSRTCDVAQGGRPVESLFHLWPDVAAGRVASSLLATGQSAVFGIIRIFTNNINQLQ
jgi:hypothetical protein